MNHWWFLFKLRHKRILAAIAEAERLTSGELRVFISHQKCTDAVTAAQEQFHKLGMDATQERNGILFYIAPRSRTFAIIGDAGIHAKCGDAFWQELASMMSTAFKAGKLTEGLVATLQRAGQLLAEHFPRRDDDHNELPDAIVRG
jgi:uncharacterized membrane protein